MTGSVIGSRARPLGTLCLLLALTAGVTTPAAAHPRLQRSVPAAGASVSVPLRELRLTFSEGIVAALSSVELRDADGRRVSLGAMEGAPDAATTVAAAIRDSLEPGIYTVLWKAAGDDGHPTRGRFTFTVLPKADNTGPVVRGTRIPTTPKPASGHHPASTFPNERPGFGVESPGYVVVRWLLFAGLLLVIGVEAFQRVTLGMVARRAIPAGAAVTPGARSRAATIGVIASLLLLAAVCARLIAQVYAATEPGAELDPALMSTMLFRTVWGRGWLIQFGATLLVVVLYQRERRSASRSAWALVAVLVLSFTPALSGHALAVGRLVPLAVAADGLHLLGAGGWLGTLAVLVLAGLPAAGALNSADRGVAVTELVNAFSPAALFFAGLTATMGTFAAWLHVGTVAALWQSGYGRTLLVKLGVLAVLVGTGAYNWRFVRPTLGTDTATARLRRSASAEVTVALFVILVTAILVATPPPTDLGMAAP